MKRYNLFALLILILSSIQLLAQDLAVVTSIGKPRKEIIKTFGEPVHIDNSIPSMVCIFYKNPNMVFVSNESGVFQADVQIEFKAENEMQTKLSKCISKAIEAGFTADTLSASQIVLDKPGIRAEINIQKITDKGTYILKIEAKHRE